MVKRTAEMILGILGGLFGIFIGLGVGALALFGEFFELPKATDIFNQSLVAIFASILGIVGGAIVGIKPKIAGALLIICAIIGLIAIGGFYIIPMIFLGVAGILALVRKDTPELSNKNSIHKPTPIDRKYCSYCGVEMASDGIFCPECGKKQPQI